MSSSLATTRCSRSARHAAKPGRSGSPDDGAREDQRAAERGRRHGALRLGLPGAGGQGASLDLHRSGDFRSRDDAHLRRHLDLSGARERDRQRQRFHHPAAGLASAHHRARRRRQDPRALQSLHPSRHHIVPLGQGQQQIVPVPLSRLEFPQQRPAARGSVAGRLRRRPARSEIQSRAGAARRIVSRLHLRHAQSRGLAARRAPRPDHDGDRRMARSQSRRQGRGLRGQPLPLQGQLEARLRQFMRRLSRRLFASFALGNRKSLCRRERQGHGLLSQLARQPADVHALHRSRQSLQGQAPEPGKAAGRPVGAGERASRHGALRGGVHQRATAIAPSRCSTSPAPSR